MPEFSFTRFIGDEDGGVTAFGLFLAMGIAVVSAVGIDYAQAQSTRTKLQSAADAGAHAALYVRDTVKGDESKKTAVKAAKDVISEMLPSGYNGIVVKDTDIDFGKWDDETRTFTVSESSTTAVRVRTYRTESRGNAVRNYLFRLVGMDTFDVVAQSVFTTFRPTCFEEGFVAEDFVDIQSNNNYLNGFCIHSNDHVEINSGNFFEDGTIVSMPDTNDLVIPESGEESNDGLMEAVRVGAYRMRLVADIPDILKGTKNMEDEYLPKYIKYRDPEDQKYVKTFKVDPADFEPGYVYYVECRGNGNSRLQFEGTTPLVDVVLITPCDIKFNTAATIINSRILSESKLIKAMDSSSKLVLGLDDDCAPGGGSQLVTAGGVSFTSDLFMYGSQILAGRDVEFSANGDGIEGASIVSGGSISGTSNMKMSFCGDGMEGNYGAEYFRMVL